MSVIDLTRLPKHIAVIMDGNGRWAQMQDRPRTVGHRGGGEAVRRVVRTCRKLGINAVTLYAFSEQNWQRPPVEVGTLMELLREYLGSERNEILQNNIRLCAIGRLDRLPVTVRTVLNALIGETSDCKGMTLTLALSYGGREEIADAARALAINAAARELDPAQITEEMFDAILPSMQNGPVDLLIRTGGEIRISNFLLWGAAYAELHFCEKLWPDFNDDDLFDAIYAFQSRERRFGRVLETNNERPLTHAATLHA